MPRFASPAAFSAIRSSRRPTRPDTRSRVSSPTELELVDGDRLIGERDPDRRGVADRVIALVRTRGQQTHVDGVDDPIDFQMLEVGERADDVERSGGDGGRERRQLGHAQPDVRIQRAVVEAEGQIRVGRSGQRNAARAGQSSRGDDASIVAAQLLAAQAPGCSRTCPTGSSAMRRSFTEIARRHSGAGERRRRRQP